MREHACAHYGAPPPQVLWACTGSRGGSSGSNSSSGSGSSGSSSGGGGGGQEQTHSRAPSRAPVRSLLRSVPVVDDSTAAVLRWRPTRRADSSTEGPPNTAPSATLSRAIKVQLRFVLCGAAKLFAFTAWKGVPPVEGAVVGAVVGAGAVAAEGNGARGMVRGGADAHARGLPPSRAAAHTDWVPRGGSIPHRGSAATHHGTTCCGPAPAAAAAQRRTECGGG